jgi:hypothetical protein
MERSIGAMMIANTGLVLDDFGELAELNGVKSRLSKEVSNKVVVRYCNGQYTFGRQGRDSLALPRGHYVGGHVVEAIHSYLLARRKHRMQLECFTVHIALLTSVGRMYHRISLKRH